MFKVTNRDRYPQSTFLEADKIRPSVEVDGAVYLLVGYEDGQCVMVNKALVDHDQRCYQQGAPRLHVY